MKIVEAVLQVGRNCTQVHQGKLACEGDLVIGAIFQGSWSG